MGYTLLRCAEREMNREQSLTEAVIDLAHECMRDKNTKSGYHRTLKALKTIGLSNEAIGKVLYELSYADPDGKPYKWLTIPTSAR